MPRRNRKTSKRQSRKTTPDAITIRTHTHTIARAGFTNYCTTCGDITTPNGSN